MSIDRETVRKVARLARIAMPDEKLDVYAPQIERIMGVVEQLGKVNTDGVEPLASVVENELSLRPDTVTDGNDAAGVLSNAPETMEGYFVVPKVVE